MYACRSPNSRAACRRNLRGSRGPSSPRGTSCDIQRSKSSQVKSSQCESSRVKSKRVRSSQIKPSQAKPSQVKPSRVKSPHICKRPFPIHAHSLPASPRCRLTSGLASWSVALRQGARQLPPPTCRCAGRLPSCPSTNSLLDSLALSWSLSAAKKNMLDAPLAAHHAHSSAVHTGLMKSERRPRMRTTALAFVRPARRALNACGLDRVWREAQTISTLMIGIRAHVKSSQVKSTLMIQGSSPSK